MVIGDLYVAGVLVNPLKADSPLIVYAYRILSRPSTFEFFEAVARRRSKVVNRGCIVEHAQLTQRHLLNFDRQRFRASPSVDAFRIGIFEGLDHPSSVRRTALSVKHPTPAVGRPALPSEYVLNQNPCDGGGHEDGHGADEPSEEERFFGVEVFIGVAPAPESERSAARFRGDGSHSGDYTNGRGGITKNWCGWGGHNGRSGRNERTDGRWCAIVVTDGDKDE